MVILSKTSRTMTLFGLIAFIYLLQTSFANKNTIPVFLLDHDQVMMHVQFDPNPFAKLTSANFADIIHDSIKRSEAIIIFVEDSFSAEDISTKDKYGTPFINLRAGLKEEKVKYFPAVIEPYKLLKQIFQPQQNNVFYLSSRTKLQLLDHFKYMYVFFQDGVNETRAQVLRRHDSIIREVIFVVRQLKPGPVVAFYTGKLNPVVVKKLEFATNTPHSLPKKKGVVVVSSGAIFRLFGVYAATQTRRALFDQMPLVAEETFTRQTLSTKVAYPVFDMEFSFSFNDDGWILDFVAIYEGDEEVGRTDMGVGAPWNYSYYCPEPIIVVNTRDGSSITITQYQIEPRFLASRRDGLYQLVNGTSELRSEHTGFNQSIHCGPYFTSTILACLMVTVFCLSICLYGIMTMFDCVSNDRFEDPNSKPLTHDLLH